MPRKKLSESRARLQCSKCGSRNTRRVRADELATAPVRTPPKAAVKKREKRKPRTPSKPKDVPLPLHKRIGVTERKLVEVEAEWRKFPHRAELDINGRPEVPEKGNVKWVEDRVRHFRAAHAIYHEVLMPDAECEFEIGYRHAGRGA
jgi:hypothetical protein